MFRAEISLAQKHCFVFFRLYALVSRLWRLFRLASMLMCSVHDYSVGSWRRISSTALDSSHLEQPSLPLSTMLTSRT